MRFEPGALTARDAVIGASGMTPGPTMNALLTRTARVAISACSVEQRFRLEHLLQRSGWDIVINAPLKTGILSRVREVRPAALVVDLEHASDHDMEVLRFLLPRCTIPVLVVDDELRQTLGDDDALAERLGDKLSAMVDGRYAASVLSPALEAGAPVSPATTVAIPAVSDATISSPPVSEPTRPEPPVSSDRAPSVPVPDVLLSVTSNVVAAARPASGGEPPQRDTANNERARAPASVATRPAHVWVLGASLGGPGAIRRFLGGIPPDLDVAFVLVQRIAPPHVPILVKQLNNSCAFEVVAASHGELLRSGQVVVVPVDRWFALDAGGRITMLESPQVTGISPLDHAMQSVARRYHASAGTIIFSGMGDDGSKGCHAIREQGGAVWTQDAASCVIDSMPKHVRHACDVDLDAAPEVLAANLVEKLSAREYTQIRSAGG